MKQRVIISTNWNPWHAWGIYLCWQHLEYIALRRCSGSETHLPSVTPLKNGMRNVISFCISVGFNASNMLGSYKTLLFNHCLKEGKIKFQKLVSCVGFLIFFSLLIFVVCYAINSWKHQWLWRGKSSRDSAFLKTNLIYY